MKFNVDKSKVITVGKERNPQYSLGSNILDTSNSERDLGVLVSGDLKPRQ